MIKKSEVVSLGYRVSREIASRLYCLRHDLQNHESFNFKRSRIKECCHVNNKLFRQYKKRWLPWSSSLFISRKELEVYCHTSSKQSLDYMPVNVYFTTIDPILNDKQMAWGYAEKGNYRKLFGVDNEPLSLFRDLNGLSFDYMGQLITEPEKFLNLQLKEQTKVLVKPVVDSWGGRSVLVFERDNSGKWQCLNGQVSLSLEKLKKFYSGNFVVQQYIQQHPFFARFNASSFNTLRVYVYRSPSDEVARVLHSTLRVGKPGSIVDNVKAGGSHFYLNHEGRFTFGLTKNFERLDYLPGEPQVALKDLEDAPGVADIYALATRVALNIPFSRVIAFDINLDANGKPRLIELNTSEAGIGSQLFGHPFFGEYTDEVIEYCRKQKKVDFLRI